MLLSPTPLKIDSPETREVVLGRLRRTAAEWRESALSPLARKMGVLGWSLFESNTGIELIARGFLWNTPAFKGSVVDTPSGSAINGRLSVLAVGVRTELEILLAVPWIVAALVLVVPISGVRWNWIRVPIAGGIALGALAVRRGFEWVVDRQWRAMYRVVTDVLQAAAQGSSTGA